MQFGQSIRSVFSQYASFSGRAPRSEFWYWALFQWLILGLVLTGSFIFMSDDGFFSLIAMLAIVAFYLATILPTLAVSVRRMHDMDRVGWWVLLGVGPYIGAIILLIWFMFPGTRGDNFFGPDPLDQDPPFDDDDHFYKSSIPSVGTSDNPKR